MVGSYGFDQYTLLFPANLAYNTKQIYKKKGHMPKIPPRQTCDKKIKGGGGQCVKVGITNAKDGYGAQNPKGNGMYGMGRGGGNIMTCHGGFMNMDMGINAYGRYTWT